MRRLTFLSLLAGCGFAAVAQAAELPSLFRGIVVADSQLGVRVVSVEERSQAHLADLRPEDIIVRIGEEEVNTIDEFAALSNRMKGQAVRTTLVVFRGGTPRELSLHLYSYPLIREWEIEFVPEHDIRFAEAHVGLAYWARLGRGFEEANKPLEALGAYLNALHHAPVDSAVALSASRLYLRLSEEALAERRLGTGVAFLRQGVTMLDHLFDYPLTDEQLATVRDGLRASLEALRHLQTRQLSSTLRTWPSN